MAVEIIEITFVGVDIEEDLWIVREQPKEDQKNIKVAAERLNKANLERFVTTENKNIIESIVFVIEEKET